jgi:Tol biopolymer transport system component
VLAVYDIGLHAGSPYLVSELLKGESLRSRLRSGRLSPQRALDYARQIAAGMAAAHAAGVVHRDLKPENLFITEDGRVKILDFGLAKLPHSRVAAAEEETQTFQTTPGTILGTVAYMSPEQIRAQPLDQRTDIFSFGCVLHEMLTGEQPFKGDSSADKISAILTQERPELELTGVMAPALERIVGHCLEKRPEDRFQSAQDLLFALSSISEISQVRNVPVAPRRRHRWIVPAAALLVLAAIVGAFMFGRVSTPQTQPEFQRLTYRRGTIGTARFAPDGQTVVYGAIWGDEPAEIFTVEPESPESRPLGLTGDGLLGISRTGELALLLKQSLGHSPPILRGLLARVPFAGGSPRPIEDRIISGDWSPDGRQLALVRETDNGVQLEYPPRRVLYRTAGFISSPRISPSGQWIGFIDHPLAYDTGGIAAVVGKEGGAVKPLTPRFSSADGLAWSPKGDEIWFSAAARGSRQDLWAVTLDGKSRLVYRQSASVVLHDISPGGRVLIATVEARQRMISRRPSDTHERDLTWLDWSLPTDLSPDGRLVAFSESGEGAAGNPAVYLRELSGAPAVKLGSGAIATFSPDGQSVVAVDSENTRIIVYPIGPGPTKEIRLSGFAITAAGLLAGGKGIWFDGNEPGHERRFYLTSLNGDKPRPFTPEGIQPMVPFATPDGRNLIARMDGRIVLLPAGSGDPQPLPGIEEGERTTGWAADDQSFLVFRRGDSPTKVYRVDRRTGQREFVQEIGSSERAGTGHMGTNLLMTADGKSYVYSTEQMLSELYLVTGLQVR